GADAGLALSVTTFAVKTYSLVVRRGQEPGKVLVTADWSPWTFVVNAVPLQRVVLPESALISAP
ncbi:MAG: hypothetical protein ABSG63_16490, partial [Spirochaetia bacterium]